MIRIEADENDLRSLAEIAGGSAENLSNLRITEDAQIAFDVVQDEWYKPDVSVKIDVTKVSDTSLDVDFTLGAANSLVPDWLVSGGNMIAGWIDGDLGSRLEKQCRGLVRRQSSTGVSFDVQTLCERLNIPLAVSIADVSLDDERFTLDLELE